MSKSVVDIIEQSIKERFRTFGGGQKSDTNPIVNAMSDQDLIFAAGVSVRDVVVHVLGCARKTSRKERTKK